MAAAEQCPSELRAPPAGGQEAMVGGPVPWLGEPARSFFKNIIKKQKKLRTPDSPWPFATIGYWLLESTTPAGLSSALLYRKKGIGASLPSAAKVKVIGTPPPPLPPTNTDYLLAS